MTEKHHSFSQHDQVVQGPQTNIGEAKAPVFSGEFHGQVNIQYPFEPGNPLVPWQIPRPPADFTGREADLKDLLANFDSGATIISLCGMGGIGKTALAFVLAEKIKSHFSDGQIFVELRGTSDKPMTVAEAMAHIIHAYRPDEKRPESETELNGLYRTVLEGKRALILLDNAADDRHVRPLLPPANCSVLITSRKKFTLPGMPEPFFLKPMEPQEACDLLMRICPRINSHTGELANLCGYLPLALRAAASLLAIESDLKPKSYLEELHSERTRLEKIGKEGVELDVGASFNLSYQRLPDVMALALRLLSVFPEDFDAKAEEFICQDENHRQLSRLVTLSLVDYRDSADRYRLHDLTRIFVTKRLERDGEDARLRAQQRHAQHYLAVLSDADRLYLRGGKSLQAGMAIFDIEWKNIQAGQTWAEKNSEGNDRATALCSAYPLEGFYLLGLRQHPQEEIRWLEPALNATRKLKDRRTEGFHLGGIGRAYAHMGENRKAIGYYEQHLAISREVGDRVEEGWALGNIGNAYRKLGKARNAIDYCSQHLLIAREMKDWRGEGNALGNIGQAHASLGEYRKAIGYYEQHLTISRERGNRRGERDALGNLGIAYAALGDFQKAINYYEQALAISNEMDDKRGKGDVLGNMGAAYTSQGKPLEAIDCCEQALIASRGIGDRHREGEALGHLGQACVAMGDVQKAILYCEQSLSIAREIGDRRGEGNRLGSMGAVYFHIGEARKAIDYFEQALSIACEIEDRRGEGNQLGNLANAYSALADTNKAIEYYKQAIAIDHEIEDVRGEAADLGNLGNSHLVLGEVHKAIEYYEQSLVVARKIGEKRSESSLLGSLGLAYSNLGDTRKAIEYHKNGLAIALEIKDRWSEGSHQGNLGNCCYMLGEFLKAIGHYEKALSIAYEIGDKRNEGIWLGALGSAFEKLGKLEKAVRYTKKALDIFEQIGSPYSDQAKKTLAKWQGDEKPK